jgi:hypothetical protein
LRCVAQDCSAVSVAQPGHSENIIHGVVLPPKRKVGPQNDLADSDLRDQMPQSLARKDQAIEVKPLEIFAGVSLDGFAAAGVYTAVRTAYVRRQEASCVSRANLESGKAIEGPFKN